MVREIHFVVHMHGLYLLIVISDCFSITNRKLKIVKKRVTEMEIAISKTREENHMYKKIKANSGGDKPYLKPQLKSNKKTNPQDKLDGSSANPSGKPSDVPKSKKKKVQKKKDWYQKKRTGAKSKGKGKDGDYEVDDDDDEPFGDISVVTAVDTAGSDKGGSVMDSGDDVSDNGGDKGDGGGGDGEDPEEGDDNDLEGSDWGINK
jgi:hypothetical protein